MAANRMHDLYDLKKSRLSHSDQ